MIREDDLRDNCLRVCVCLCVCVCVFLSLLHLDRDGSLCRLSCRRLLRMDRIVRRTGIGAFRVDALSTKVSHGFDFLFATAHGRVGRAVLEQYDGETREGGESRRASPGCFSLSRESSDIDSQTMATHV